LLCTPGARCRRSAHRWAHGCARSGPDPCRTGSNRAAAQERNTALQPCSDDTAPQARELLRTMRTCGFYGGIPLALPGAGWSIAPTDRRPANLGWPRPTAPQSYGGPMLVFSDPTSTLCTAVVAGFAFGLLLLGNRRR
jgi:hypothetical protein